MHKKTASHDRQQQQQQRSISNQDDEKVMLLRCCSSRCAYMACGLQFSGSVNCKTSSQFTRLGMILKALGTCTNMHTHMWWHTHTIHNMLSTITGL